MKKQIKQFSVFDVQGERFKASSFDEYKQKSEELANRIYSARMLLEKEIACSELYYKQLLSWAELITKNEISITDILSKGKYSKEEIATKKVALINLIKIFKKFLKNPTNELKTEIYRRFILIKLRKDSLNNIKKAVLLKRMNCSKDFYDKVVMLDDIIESSCGKMTGMYMPYAINLANKRGVRFDEEGNVVGTFVDDYIQAALIGIYEAAKHFNPTKNINFTTYAWYWMIQGFGDVVENSEMIRFPRNILLLKNKINKTSFKESTNLEELSASFNQTKNSIEKALNCNRTISLERPANAEEDNDNILDDLTDGQDIEKEAVANNERQIVIDIIKENLNPREEQFVYMRFGFFDYKPHTLKEIAQKSDMTTEGVRQITKNALKKIIPGIVEKLGEDYGEQDTEKVLKMYCEKGK